jgi:hypothetical protein
MKNVKMLLMAVTVLTAVGGTLAFKAAKFNAAFCTRGESGACTSFITNSKQVTTGGTLFFATPTTNTDNCKNASCTSQIRLIAD